MDFTCEGYDYYQFLAKEAPDRLLELYRTFVDPSVTRAQLMLPDGTYDRLNRWNTRDGAMHLTHGANSLFAEVFLAASATARRRKTPAGAELTASLPLIRCARYGDDTRNSDPAIGAAVNAIARQKRHITLANPVGLYIAGIDENAFRLPDGSPATGFFQIVRGTATHTLRARFAPTAAAAAAGLTISDLSLGGAPVRFGGQIATKITMKLTAIASVAQDVGTTPVACGGIPQVDPPAGPASVPFAAPGAPSTIAGADPRLPTRSGT